MNTHANSNGQNTAFGEMFLCVWLGPGVLGTISPESGIQQLGASLFLQNARDSIPLLSPIVGFFRENWVAVLIGFGAVLLIVLGLLALRRRQRRVAAWRARQALEESRPAQEREPAQAEPSPEISMQELIDDLNQITSRVDAHDESIRGLCVAVESLKLMESDSRKLVEESREQITSVVEQRLNELSQRHHSETRELNQLLRDTQMKLDQFLRNSDNHPFKRWLSEVYEENTELRQRAAELEQELINFFRRGVPLGDAPEELLQRSERMCRTLDQIISRVKLTDGGSSKVIEGLTYILNNIGQLHNELLDWRSQQGQQRLKLRFMVEVPTYEGARRTIMDALATGLEDQIKKLQDSNGHFQYRFDQLATTGATYVTDLCDKELDRARTDAEIQNSLAELFKAAGLEEIAPKKHDAFRPSEQSVVQLIPGRSGQERSQTVAQLVTRGFRYKNNLVRKASVMLYR